MPYNALVIISFRHKGLADLWNVGHSSKLDARLVPRILRRLDAIEAAVRIEDLTVPGFDFHALKGFNPKRYTIHVNGPWCITFEFADGEATGLSLEQYH